VLGGVALSVRCIEGDDDALVCPGRKTRQEDVNLGDLVGGVGHPDLRDGDTRTVDHRGGACHFFHISHGMANGVTLSQRKSSWEEDGHSVQSHCPAHRSRSGVSTSFTGDIPQPEVEQLHCRLVGREVTSSLSNLAELETE
jgi:hypothetical protein